MTSRSQHRRLGRRPGSPDTRGQILQAARAVFSELGYEAATVRVIADEAEVNPALVHHYFGSKEQLFVAAVELPFEPRDVAQAIAEVPSDSRGEQMARLFFAVWDDPVRRAPVLALFRSAMAHESAAKLLRQFAQRVMVARVAQSLPGPNPELRAEAAVSHLFGLAVARYVLRVEPLASTPIDDVVALVAPVIQRYFDG